MNISPRSVAIPRIAGEGRGSHSRPFSSASRKVRISIRPLLNLLRPFTIIKRDKAKWNAYMREYRRRKRAAKKDLEVK